LTQHYREVFSNLACVKANQLSVVDESTSIKSTSSRSINSLSKFHTHYALPWPVANIIRRESMPLYQRISTFLLQVRRAKQLLEQQPLKSTYTQVPAALPTANLIFSLRHRLFWFVSTLQSYLSTAVLAEATAAIRAQMDNSLDLDDMIAVHAAYVQRLETQCIVSAPLASTHKAILALLDLVVVYADTCSLVKARALTTRPRTAQKKIEGRSFDSSDEGEGEGGIAGTAKESGGNEDGLREKLQKLSGTYTRLLGFVLAGVREVSRSRAEPCWEILVDNLAFGVSNSGGA